MNHRSVLFGSCLLLALTSHSAETRFSVFRSNDAGRSWQAAGTGLPPGLRIDALAQNGGVWIAGSERGLFRTEDHGTTWTRPERGVPETLKTFDLATNGPATFAATTQGVWRSTDQGQTWAPIDPPGPAGRILSLGLHHGRLHAGTDGHGVEILDADGTGWAKIDQGLPPGAQVFQLAFHKDTAFAALYARGVCRLDAESRTWKPTSPEQPLRLVSAGGLLFAGRNPGGLFTSHDGGASWTNTSQGLPLNAPTWAMASHGGTAWLGTSGGSGLMRFDATSRTWLASDRGLPPDSSAIAFGPGAEWFLTVVIHGPRNDWKPLDRAKTSTW